MFISRFPYNLLAKIPVSSLAGERPSRYKLLFPASGSLNIQVDPGLKLLDLMNISSCILLCTKVERLNEADCPGEHKK